jgi:ribosomal protein S8
MAIDYQKIYEKALINKELGISIKDTVYVFLGHRDTSNLYKSLTKEQKDKLKNAKYLSEKQKEEFKRLYLEKGYTMSQLRAKYKIRTKTAIEYINSVSGEYSRSFKNHNRKLTKYQVIKILIERMKYGTLQRELAEKYNVSESRISCICTGRDWKHIFQGVRQKYNKEILSLKSNT